MTTGLPPGLDWDICDRARLARDRAFDGAFFTGVRTTRIYCRPVCPVRPALSANVVFFGSAAAGERAGFRPCLRCRPETAPGSPAWSGTATTVARGMRLIEEGFLDEGSVAELADRLDVAGPAYCLFDHFSTGMKRRKIRDDGSMSPGLTYKPKSRTERSHKKSRSSLSPPPLSSPTQIEPFPGIRCPTCRHQLRLSGECEPCLSLTPLLSPSLS